MTIKHKLIFLILGTTMIRLILGYCLELGNDEVYYWTYAKFPDWSHFDHPPMVGFFEQIFSLNLLFDSEIALRLGFIIAGSLSTLLLYHIGKEIKDERTGLITALLYNTSIYGFILSGLFIMPDGPLVLFWMSSLLFFIKACKAMDQLNSGGSGKKINFYISLSMISLALAIYSKYQAVYLLFGYGIYFLLYRRDQLRNPVLYLNLIFSALVIFIIVYWNYLNSFSGVTYHSERVTLLSSNFNSDSFFRELFGQIAYNNPYNYIVILMAIIAFKKQQFMEKQLFHLLLLLSIPLIVTTIFFSLFRDTLPHWSGVSFLSLTPVAGAYLSGRTKTPVLYITLFSILGLSLIGLGVVNKGWIIDLGSTKKENIKLGKNDPTLDMFGWDQFRMKLEDLELQHSELKPLPIVSNKWYPGSHLYYYVANPMGKELFVLGNMKDMHKYYWINQYKKALEQGQNAIYITHSRNFKNPNKTMSAFFEQMILIEEFPIIRSGKTVEYGYIYLLKGYKMSNLDERDKE